MKRVCPTADLVAEAFGQRLARHRAAAGLSRAELATMLDVGFEVVWRWERGSAMPTYNHLVKIVELLDTTFDALLAPERT